MASICRDRNLIFGQAGAAGQIADIRVGLALGAECRERPVARHEGDVVAERPSFTAGARPFWFRAMMS